MEKQSVICLFGAGSVLDWGGPQTGQLTDAIRRVGFTIKGSSQKLTDYIHQTLIQYGYDESEVNFETIINVIEELSIYFSEFNPTNRTPSLLRAFISGQELENIFDFAIKCSPRRNLAWASITTVSFYRNLMPMPTFSLLRSRRISPLAKVCSGPHWPNTVTNRKTWGSTRGCNGVSHPCPIFIWCTMTTTLPELSVQGSVR